MLVPRNRKRVWEPAAKTREKQRNVTEVILTSRKVTEVVLPGT